MMGVFPPGSVVELTDGRHAMVMSVNASRPLKPSVMVHDAGVPAAQAPVLALELFPELGIRRGVAPAQLPRDALDYLSRSEEHTSELQSPCNLVCRLLLEKKKKKS